MAAVRNVLCLHASFADSFHALVEVSSKCWGQVPSDASARSHKARLQKKGGGERRRGNGFLGGKP